jgi:hypothetical protein
MRSPLLAIATALLASATACKSTGPTADSTRAEAGATAASAPAPGGTSSAPPSPLAIPGATVVAVAGEPFPERFAGEAAGRSPGIKPRVEDVYAALASGGLTIVGQKQHLASPLGARYCVGAQATSDKSEPLLQISVCECSTPEVAQAARDFTARTANIPLRTAYANKQTMLVLREEKSAPEIDALVTKAADIFAKL